MRILVLSFYYQPDLCAGSFRCTPLVERLLKSDSDCTIDVVTTLPNRYVSFSADAPKFEHKERLDIHRIELPTHKSGMFDQAKAFISYYVQAIKLTKNNEYDLVYATSSRLFTAFLGRRIASRKKLPLYLDIRDIFIDTLENILPIKISRILSPFLKVIENYTFSNAKKINLVSEGFLPYFSQRYPQLSYDFFTNGIDGEFIGAQQGSSKDSGSAVHQTPEPCQKGIKTIVYAGNIGEGQGLHRIIPNLAKKLDGEFIIKIIGDGGRKEKLVNAVSVENISNVEFLSPVNRHELIEHYHQADVLFLHLNDYDAFKKVLPSKIFEYATFDKPILAGVAGFAADFMTGRVENAGVFRPCDAEDAVLALSRLVFTSQPRTEFIEKHKRENIMSSMAESILSVAKDHG